MVAPTLFAFVSLLVAAAIVSLAVGSYVYREYRQLPGGLALVVLLAFLSLWSLSYALQALSGSLATKMVWARFVATGSIGSATAWAGFVLAYTGRRRWLEGRRLAVLLAIPVLTSAAAWTNHVHQLVWQAPTTETFGDLSLLTTTKGPAFALTLGYGYFLVLASLGLLVAMYVRSRDVHRGQSGLLLVAGTVPLVGNAVFYALGRSRLPVDVTPLLFTLTGLLVALALIRYKLLDVLPVSPGAILEELADAVVVVDEQDRIVHTNAAGRNLFPDASVGDRLARLLPDGGTDDSAIVGTEIQLARDGETRYFDMRESALAGQDETEGGSMYVFRNITERKRREQELAEYKTIFETTFEKVYVLDEEGVVRHANEPLAGMLGLTPAEMEGSSAATFIRPEAFERGNEVIAELYASGKRHGTVELTLEDADGEQIPCETHLTLLPFDEEYQGCVGVVRDVSERKEAESALRRTSSTLESIFEAAPLAIVSVTDAGRVDRWNPGATDVFGWAADAALGRPLTDLFGGYDEVEDLVDSVLGGERLTNRQLSLRDGSGGRIEVTLAAAPVPDGEGGVEGAVFIVADVTERRQREQQVAVLNRVLRHNLRNDLGIVIGQLEVAADEIPEESRANLDAAFDHAQALLDFAQKARQAERIFDTDAEPAPTDVSSLVEGVVDDVADRYPDAEVAVRDYPTVSAVAHPAIDVALTDVLENAIDHNDRDTATVTVSVTATTNHVTVRVSDDGPGIPDHELAVLESGTESPLEHGSGLGLWLVHWVVTRSGGFLSFEGNEPRGTSVEVTLPRASTKETESGPVSADDADPTGE